MDETTNFYEDTMNKEQALKLEEVKFDVVPTKRFQEAKEKFYIYVEQNGGEFIQVIKLSESCGDIVCESRSGKRFAVYKTELFNSRLAGYLTYRKLMLLDAIENSVWSFTYRLNNFTKRFLNKFRK